METIGKYKVHELASILPLVTEEEFAELKESIRTQGLLHPIIISDFDPLLIIDGRNRARACIELGQTPRFKSLNEYLSDSAERRELTWMTDDLTGLREAEEMGDYNAVIKHFIIMQNVTRRHLSDWQKFKNILAFENDGNLPKHGGDHGNQHKKKDKVASPKNSNLARKGIAETLGISPAKVDQMIAIEKDAPEELKKDLQQDKISLNKAYEEIKEMKKKKPLKVKKLSWFEQNIEDENIRFIWEEAVKIKSKIENRVGVLYMPEFLKIISKIDKTNYEILWKEQLN